MPLPNLIEIVPLTSPVSAVVTVPGSKSITNRALILAALSSGWVTLRGALWSEDTQVMTAALRQLGFAISLAPDEAEFCNRTLHVRGLGGKHPQRRHSGQALGTFCRQRGNGGAVFGGAGLPGPRRLSAAADARACTNVPRPPCSPPCAQLGYRSDRPTTGCRPISSGRGRARRACRGGHRRKFAIRLRPSALRRAPAGWQVRIGRRIRPRRRLMLP